MNVYNYKVNIHSMNARMWRSRMIIWPSRSSDPTPCVEGYFEDKVRITPLPKRSKETEVVTTIDRGTVRNEFIYKLDFYGVTRGNPSWRFVTSVNKTWNSIELFAVLHNSLCFILTSYTYVIINGYIYLYIYIADIRFQKVDFIVLN